jgi:alpha-ribazole phosphatase
MEIYLIRHTTPLVPYGTCYGQSDLNVTDSFEEEALAIAQHLPQGITTVHSSPLQRCYKLAQFLFPSHAIQQHTNFKEINCGDWEGKLWNDIPRHISDPWMEDFVNNYFPNGENYVQLFNRVATQFNHVVSTTTAPPIAIVSHGGVMRCILAAITNTPLKDSFAAFRLHYGAVVKLTANGQRSFDWHILHNDSNRTPEVHRPTR